MFPDSTPTLSQRDLARLDAFLHSTARGRDAMGVSRAHGCLTAAARGPEAVEAAEWLRLVFDEPVFPTGAAAQEMLGLAPRLYRDIEQSLAMVGRFRPLFDPVAAGEASADASAWCRGFVSGMSLCRGQCAAHARGVLHEPLQVILRLADANARGRRLRAVVRDTAVGGGGRVSLLAGGGRWRGLSACPARAEAVRRSMPVALFI